MNIQNLNRSRKHPSAPSLRAKNLLKALPESGTGQDRSRAARAALDTLVREYGSRSEVDAAKLAKAVGRKASLPVTQDEVYKMGLQSVADGMAGSGAGLAALAIRFTEQAVHGNDSLLMAEAAVDVLKRRDDTQGTMKFTKAVRPGWFDPGFGSKHRENIAMTLLNSTAEQVSVTTVGRRLFNAAYEHNSDGTERRTTRISKALLRVAKEGVADGQVRRTFEIAGKMRGRDLGTTASVTDAFFQEFPHTLKGRAQRMLALEGRHDSVSRRSSWTIPQEGLRIGLGELIQDAKAEGNENWKFLEVSRSAGETYRRNGNPVEMMKMGLKQLVDEELEATPQGLARFSADLVENCNSLSLYHSSHGLPAPLYKNSLSPALKDVNSSPSWKAAFGVLDAAANWAGNEGYGDHGMGAWGECCVNTLNALGQLESGKSPFLVACHEMVGFTRNSGPGSYRGMIFGEEQLAQVWAVAEGLSEDPQEIKALRAARKILRTEGISGAEARLAAFL